MPMLNQNSRWWSWSFSARFCSANETAAGPLSADWSTKRAQPLHRKPTAWRAAFGKPDEKDKSYLNEASERAKFLYTDPLPVNINSFKSKTEFAQAIEKTSHMPPDSESMRGEAIWKISNGLRVFGWTHIYSIPYLIYWLNNKP